LRNPILLSFALFSLLSACLFLYLYPSPNPSTNPLSPSLSPPTGLPFPSDPPAAKSEKVLKVASCDPGLSATVNPRSDVTQIQLENTGKVPLSRIKVSADGRILGILSELSPGEKKILAAGGPVEDVSVTANDPSKREVRGEVLHLAPREYLPLPTGGAAPEPEQQLTTMSVFAPASSAVEKDNLLVLSGPSQPSPISLMITTNKSEGREGDAVEYRCTAVNCGDVALSSVRIFCGERMASTTFLTPGQELHLDGSLAISDHLQLQAGAEGRDAQGRLWTNNTSMEIWKVSPQLALEASAPSEVHRGDVVTLTVRLQNMGEGNLTDLAVSDSFGPISRIDLLLPGEARMLEASRRAEEPLSEKVKAVGLDSSRNQVYACQNLEIRVLKAALEIESQPAQQMVYPHQPAEVTWVLNNTGVETLSNITLSGSEGKCTLRELSPGRSVRMAAIYSVDRSGWVNVTAHGSDQGGYPVLAEGAVFLKALQPAIGLRINPSEAEISPGENAEFSLLVTNAGDDFLSDIVLGQDGGTLATLEGLAPGEFRVIDVALAVSKNSTLSFAVEGTDSNGKIWTAAAQAQVRIVTSALKILARASPIIVKPGQISKITCKVTNSGSIPLYNVFVISKTFGPLGTIDYLPPKRQQEVGAEVPVSAEVQDSITAEGFTQEKESVRGTAQLRIAVLSLGGAKEPSGDALQEDDTRPRIEVSQVDIHAGKLSVPMALPSGNRTAKQATRQIATDIDRSTKGSSQMALNSLSDFLCRLQKVLELLGYKAEVSSFEDEPTSSPQESMQESNYELSIEGVRGSEHGAIMVLDVGASPSQPPASTPVKITTHVKSGGLKEAKVRWGLSEAPLTKQDMSGVARVKETSMSIESGTEEDGYWSCIIPGQPAGTYLVLSVSLSDGLNSIEDGPYLLHWSTVSSPAKDTLQRDAISQGKGMLFIESSSVSGKGDVSIKDSIQGSTVNFEEKLWGNGSINLESLRCIDKKASQDKFTQQKDLVFTGGVLHGRQTIESPSFYGGIGASVSERFNLTHVDRSESSGVEDVGRSNKTLAYSAEQAFEGSWNIKTQYAKFYRKIKADQQYTGSFQTQKNIKFEDMGKA
jgi:hypothetical protein